MSPSYWLKRHQNTIHDSAPYFNFDGRSDIVRFEEKSFMSPKYIMLH